MSEPNDYDRAARYQAKVEPAEFLGWALDESPDRFRFVRWLDTRTIPFPGSADRTHDTVAHLERTEPPGEPWAIPLEFQYEPDPLMFGRLLEYLGRLWQAEKPSPERGDRYRVGAVVVNLYGNGRASHDFEWQPGGPRTCLRVMERNLGNESADATLAAIAAGSVRKMILPFIPLMSGGGESGIIEAWLRLASAEANPRKKSDLGVLARIYARGTKAAVAWKLALKEWDVLRSPVADELRAEGQAAVIVALLESRFQAISEELADAIRAVSDLKRLMGMAILAMKTPSIDQFRTDAGL
jgi:hypothetical protein